MTFRNASKYDILYHINRCYLLVKMTIRCNIVTVLLADVTFRALVDIMVYVSSDNDNSHYCLLVSVIDILFC